MYFPQTLFSVQMYSPNIPPKNSIWLVGRGTLSLSLFSVQMYSPNFPRKNSEASGWWGEEHFQTSFSGKKFPPRCWVAPGQPSHNNETKTKKILKNSSRSWATATFIQNVSIALIIGSAFKNAHSCQYWYQYIDISGKKFTKILMQAENGLLLIPPVVFTSVYIVPR